MIDTGPFIESHYLEMKIKYQRFGPIHDTRIKRDKRFQRKIEILKNI